MGTVTTACGDTVSPALMNLTKSERDTFGDAGMRFVLRYLTRRSGNTFIARDFSQELTAASLSEAGLERWTNLALSKCRGLDVRLLAPSLASLRRLSLHGVRSGPSVEWCVQITTVLELLPHRSLESLDVSVEHSDVAHVPRDLTLSLEKAILGYALLEDLDISGWQFSFLAELGTTCKRLTRLVAADYEGSSLASVDLDIFSSLKILDCSSTRVSTTQMVGVSESLVASWMSRLVDLRLEARNWYFQRNVLLVTLRGRERLQQPRLLRCAHLQLRKLSLRSTLGIDLDVGGGGANLLYLDISSCTFAPTSRQGQQQHRRRHWLTTITPRLQNLRHLACAAVGLNDSDFCVALETLPSVGRLRHLDVSYNPSLSHTVVAKVVANLCVRLVVLKALLVGAASVSAVVDGIPQVNNKRRLAKKPGYDCCTANAFGARYHVADAYHCVTCSILGDDVICAHCARTCHSNHHVFYGGKILMYCDCPTHLTGDDCVKESSCSRPPDQRPQRQSTAT